MTTHAIGGFDLLSTAPVAELWSALAELSLEARRKGEDIAFAVA